MVSRLWKQDLDTRLQTIWPSISNTMWCLHMRGGLGQEKKEGTAMVSTLMRRVRQLWQPWDAFPQ